MPDEQTPNQLHLRTLSAIDELWRLREHIRELLTLRRQMQRSFAQRASMLPTATNRRVKTSCFVRTTSGVFAIPPGALRSLRTRVGLDPLAGRPFPGGH